MKTKALCKAAKETTDKSRWCRRHQVEWLDETVRGEAGRRAYDTSHRSNIVVKVEAVYDYALPNYTVVLHFISAKLYKRNKNRTDKVRPFEHAFSLTTKTRLHSSVPGEWWRTIRRWIADEAERQDFGFARRCRWIQVDGPNTVECATTRTFTDRELGKMARGSFDWRPVYGTLDLRESCTKPMAPIHYRPVTDFTPQKFQLTAVCGTCSREQGEHNGSALACQGHREWLEAKAKWLAWYLETMGQGPEVTDAPLYLRDQIDRVMALRDHL